MAGTGLGQHQVAGSCIVFYQQGLTVLLMIGHRQAKIFLCELKVHF